MFKFKRGSICEVGKTRYLGRVTISEGERFAKLRLL